MKSWPAFLLAAALLGPACSRPTAPTPASGPAPLRVMASFLPIYAHTARVAGDGAQVSMLLSADSGPHDYQLSPDDVKRLAQADLFIINGAGIEEWLGELIQAVGSQSLQIIDTSKGTELRQGGPALPLPGAPESHDHHHGHDHDHAHCHAGENPHIWLDPVIAIHQVQAIEAALSAADPSRAEAFRANAAAYIAELRTLDHEFRTALGSLPNKNLLTFHDAFPYLARRYQLNYVGFVEAFPEKDPSPRHLKSLIDAIRKHHIRVLFAEAGYSPKLFTAIAEQIGARVAELDTLEVGSPDPHAYLVRMRANLAALQQAWQP